MRTYLAENLKDKNFFWKKLIFLLLVIIIFTGCDLLIKEVVEQNLKDKPDIVVIKNFWHFHYVQNDDIGFSLLTNIALTSKLKIFFLLHAFGLILGIGLLFEMKKITFKKIVFGALILELFILLLFIFSVFFSRFYYNASIKTKWLFLLFLQGSGSLAVILFYIFFVNNWKYAIPIALIISGALGNVIGRAIKGYVVDYVMWTFKFIPLDLFNPWPIFNLADVYTVIGATLLLIIFLIFPEKKQDKNGNDVFNQITDDTYLSDKVKEEQKIIQSNNFTHNNHQKVDSSENNNIK